MLFKFIQFIYLNHVLQILVQAIHPREDNYSPMIDHRWSGMSYFKMSYSYILMIFLFLCMFLNLRLYLLSLNL